MLLSETPIFFLVDKTAWAMIYMDWDVLTLEGKDKESSIALFENNNNDAKGICLIILKGNGSNLKLEAKHQNTLKA